MPIIGWLQIIVVIALSELWRYENASGQQMDQTAAWHLHPV